MATDPDGKDLTVNYPGGSLTMTAGALKSLFGEDTSIITEGAILGWENNTLAWLGGSVPLPEGTYGPILSYENGVLTLEEEVSLPYLTSLFLSDAQGVQVTWSALSAPISAITNGSINDSQVWTSGYTPSSAEFESGRPVTNGFNGDSNSSSQTRLNNQEIRYYWDPVQIVDNITVDPSPDSTCRCTVYFEDGTSDGYSPEEFKAINGVISAAGKSCIGFKMTGQSTGGRTYLTGVSVDGLDLVNTGITPVGEFNYKLDLLSARARSHIEGLAALL